ncbi:MAG: GNAT family N-acetyltransferase [Acidimicrobiales bacterium]
MIRVVEVTEIDDALVAAFARLVPQLSATAPLLSREWLTSVVGAQGTTVLLALIDRSGGRTGGEWDVVGTLTLVQFLIPTGARAWIEDVVVDTTVRGLGVGAALVAGAVERARASGARSVELTSRPAREAANRLYLRAGFERRDTNVYRLNLS